MMGDFTAHEQAWFFAGALTVFCLMQIAGLIKSLAGRPTGKKELERAENVLARHKLSAFWYMPTIGVDDPELREALDRIAMHGKVILDADNRLVGRLLPKPESERGPRLRLVVDNTK